MPVEKPLVHRSALKLARSKEWALVFSLREVVVQPRSQDGTEGAKRWHSSVKC